MILVALVAILVWCLLSLPLGMLIGCALADRGPEQSPRRHFDLAA